MNDAERAATKDVWPGRWDATSSPVLLDKHASIAREVIPTVTTFGWVVVQY